MDSLIKDITVHLIAAKIPATKYFIPQDVDINNPEFKAITVKPISDIGHGSKDTIGSDNKEYTIRIDIYCRKSEDIDLLYNSVTSAMKTLERYHVRYESKEDLFDPETEQYHQSIDYEIWKI